MAFKPSYYYYVKLTLKAKADPTSTLTLYVGNRSALDESSLTIFNGLKSISGIGNGMTGNVPALGKGRVDISNKRGLFGFQKRFSDYLDTYTLISQECLIYHAKVAENDRNVSADATLFWSDTVNSVDVRGDTVSLYLRSDQIANREFTAKIDSTVFTWASNTTIGQSVPIVFGNDIQVKPLLVESTATYNNFAYATTLKRQFGTGGIQKYYAKNHRGEYVWIKSVSSGSTYSAFGVASPPSTGTSSYPFNSAKPLGGSAYKLTAASDGGYIIYGAYLRVNKPAAAPTEEIWRGSIFEALPDNGGGERNVGNVIASIQPIETSSLSTGWNNVYRAFERPVIIGASESFYFGIYTNMQDTVAPGTTKRLEPELGSTGTMVGYEMEYGTSRLTGRWSGQHSYVPFNYTLYGCFFTDAPTPPVSTYELPNGLSVAFTAMTFKTTDFTPPDLKNIDFIFEIDGLEDDSSGNITGTPNLLLESPVHVAKVLSYKYDGANWGNSWLDTTTYNGTHTQLSTTGYYSRYVAGASNGSVRAKQLLNELMSEHECYLTKVAGTNQVALYAWGKEQSIAFVINDNDIIGDIQHRIADRASIINIARGSYYKKLTNIDERRILAQGGDKSYSAFAEYRHDDNGLGEAIASKNYTLFSDNEASKDTYNFIADSTTMRNVLLARLATHQLPAELVEFQIELTRFSSIKIWDVVELITPQLPQTGGTSADPLPSTYSVAEEVLKDTDDQLVLAKPYRAQVLEIDYDLSREIPTIKILAKLLINKADPT